MLRRSSERKVGGKGQVVARAGARGKQMAPPFGGGVAGRQLRSATASVGGLVVGDRLEGREQVASEGLMVALGLEELGAKKRARRATVEGNDAEDDEGDGRNDCEKAGDRCTEFFDLLKATADEDVRIIDARLRSQSCGAAAAALGGFRSKKVEEVWRVARTLTQVDENTLEVGRRLLVLSASQTFWGRCLLAAEVAGGLLRNRLDSLKRGQQVRVRGEPPPSAGRRMDPAEYFASRMAPLVDCEGRGAQARESRKGDSVLVTFFNKELRMAYIELSLQIECSAFLAEQCGAAAYALDAEVKPEAAQTEDGMVRFDRAVEESECLYPFAKDAGKLRGCMLMVYYTFRVMINNFLEVYKELFLQGEVVLESIKPGTESAYRLVVDGGLRGYRVKGALQAEAFVRRYAYWAAEFGNAKKAAVMKRAADSRQNRADMLAEERKRHVEGLKARRVTTGLRAERMVAEAAAAAAAEANGGNSDSETDSDLSDSGVVRGGGGPRRKVQRREPPPRPALPLWAKKPPPVAVAPTLPARGVATKRKGGSARGKEKVAPVKKKKSAGGRKADCVARKLSRRAAAAAVVVPPLLSSDAERKGRGAQLDDTVGEGVGEGGKRQLSVVALGECGLGASDDESLASESDRSDASAREGGQVRSGAFDYSMVEEPPVERRYFAVTMMKAAAGDAAELGGKKPRKNSMLDELKLPDAGDHVNQYVTVEAGGEFTYMEVASLTNNLHGTHDERTRKVCAAAAREHGVACLVVPRTAGSFVSRDVSVLRGGSAELDRLGAKLGFPAAGAEGGVGERRAGQKASARATPIEANSGAGGRWVGVDGEVADGTEGAPVQMGPLGLDAGGAVQGIAHYVHSSDCTPAVAEKMLDSDGRGNLQVSFGISNHNFNTAEEAAAAGGGVATVGLQNGRNLRKHFPGGGRNIGEVVGRLARLRDELARERGDGERENNDPLRDQLYSALAAEMCGLEGLLGFEHFTLGLTGESDLLQELVKALLAKLPLGQRERAARKWSGQGAVETGDHGDSLNPKEASHSRVVLAKWRIHLDGDREGQVLVLTIIANFRSSVSVYQSKMRGIRALAAWYEESLRARQEEEAAAAEGGGRGAPGQLAFGADGDYAAGFGTVVRMGFVPEEAAVARRGRGRGGVREPAAFVSYSRAFAVGEGGGDGDGPWRRHRRTDLRWQAAEPLVPAMVAEGGGVAVADGAGEGEEAAAAAAAAAAGAAEVPPADPAEVTEEEVRRHRTASTLYGELRSHRADYDRYADFSGCVCAVEDLRDRYQLDDDQARELALCIFWHSRCRSVFLLKCQALLDGDGGGAAAADGEHAGEDGGGGAGRSDFVKEFREAARSGVQGAVGHYFMEGMVSSNNLTRMAEELTRTKLGYIVWRPGSEGSFTVEFVAKQSRQLKVFLSASARLKRKVKTADFLAGQLKQRGFLVHIGEFVIPQVLPVCYLLGLARCESWRAAEAPILDADKGHSKKFVAMGVERKHMDVTMMVVALQFSTTPLTIENTGCEVFRGQRSVRDYWLKGQMAYGMRPVAGCIYLRPSFAVYVKKAGRGGRWVEAVRDAAGRWRHP